MSAVAALEQIHSRIAAAARAAERNPVDVTLIAVTKNVDVDTITPVIAGGHLHYGENRVQEAAAKWSLLRAATPDIRLHLLGPLQTNKVKEAVAMFDVIHTLDRDRLAEILAAEMARQNRHLPCFVQINTGRESQKAGVDPDQADEFIGACRDRWKLSVAGLMCIPPVDEEPALHFAFLREIARRNGLTGLSMGMSADFETAVMFGATHVRVGSGIFGLRPQAERP